MENSLSTTQPLILGGREGNIRITVGIHLSIWGDILHTTAQFGISRSQGENLISRSSRLRGGDRDGSEQLKYYIIIVCLGIRRGKLKIQSH